jgi:hypothetical protein
MECLGSEVLERWSGEAVGLFSIAWCLIIIQLPGNSRLNEGVTRSWRGAALQRGRSISWQQAAPGNDPSRRWSMVGAW